ncbi:MAG: HDOD domain-containing protein [Gallionella sp.]|nr:HDOD domain-containing protein [Gallionella sp.]
MNKLSDELNKKLGEAVERMPAFPKSVQKILELTRDLNCSPKVLVQVIENDPVITMKILRVLNSAYYRLPSKITSINHSVVFLGLNTVKNIALSIAAIGILPKKNAAGFDVGQYLLHSLSTAALAKHLAIKSLKIGEADPMDCYVAGLLHDFGKIVFAQFMPEQFKIALEKSPADNIPLFTAEQMAIGTDHTVVGSMLAEKWQFPKALIDSIRDHHSEKAGATAMGACVFAANQISKKMQYGSAGDARIEALPPAVAKYFGSSLEVLIDSIGEEELQKIIEHARQFAQVDAS